MKTQDKKEKIWSGEQEIFLNAWMCANTLISLCVAVVNINLSLAGGGGGASQCCLYVRYQSFFTCLCLSCPPAPDEKQLAHWHWLMLKAHLVDTWYMWLSITNIKKQWSVPYSEDLRHVKQTVCIKRQNLTFMACQHELLKFRLVLQQSLTTILSPYPILLSCF